MMLGDILEEAKDIVQEGLDEYTEYQYADHYSEELIREVLKLLNHIEYLKVKMDQWDNTINNNIYENLQD